MPPHTHKQLTLQSEIGPMTRMPIWQLVCIVEEWNPRSARFGLDVSPALA